MAILSGLLPGIAQQPHPGNQTLQAWLQQQQQRNEEAGESGQVFIPVPRQQTQQTQQTQQPEQKTQEYHQWAQEHHNLRAQAAAEWEQSQQRRLEEQRAALYTLHCEAEQINDLIQQALKLREQQQQQQQQQQHQPTPPPQPNPPPPPPKNNPPPQIQSPPPPRGERAPKKK
jgi:MADS-box transcription factor